MKRTGCSYYLKLFIGTLAVLLFFVWVLLYVYKKSKSDFEQARALERARILQTMREQNQQQIATPAWIDRDKKIVRLPMDLAMQLTLEELKSKPVVAGSLAQPMPTAIAPPTTPPATPPAAEPLTPSPASTP